MVRACTMMPSGSVAAIVFQMPMPMAFVTMWMTALGNSITNVCNGPGSIYECGCAAIPAGDCDCEGNQLDALGVCGGNCIADEDQDGICDDVDACVGQYDSCGICNGEGPVFECGCTDIPAGDCDCEGNQLDALGVCGGNCSSDEDADGVCDDAEILGCTFQWACNYEPMATEDDGSCLEICEGCTDAFACNYDSSANEDDGSCVYTDPGFDCAGNCWDLDGDGACDDPLTNLVEGPIVVELDTVFGDGELDTAAISFIWNLKMRQTFSAPFFQTRSFTTGRNCEIDKLKAVGIRFRRAW